MSDEEMTEKYRFPRQGILFICDILQDHLGQRTLRCNAIPVVVQVITALHFVACGSFQRVISACFDVGLSQVSVSRIVSKFVNALVTFKNVFIKFPNSVNMIRHN